MNSTVAAGSFFGFGPLFFGPFFSFQSSFASLEPNIFFAVVEGPTDPGVEEAALLSEAGKGQSVPP